MFGADGDRILALREQQKAQYMADLQKQIEEKARRPKSPSPYSTSANDATSFHQLNNPNIVNPQNFKTDLSLNPIIYPNSNTILNNNLFTNTFALSSNQVALIFLNKILIIFQHLLRL